MRETARPGRFMVSGGGEGPRYAAFHCRAPRRHRRPHLADLFSLFRASEKRTKNGFIFTQGRTREGNVKLFSLRGSRLFTAPE